jgi:hypothetical protein
MATPLHQRLDAAIKDARLTSEQQARWLDLRRADDGADHTVELVKEVLNHIDKALYERVYEHIINNLTTETSEQMEHLYNALRAYQNGRSADMAQRIAPYLYARDKYDALMSKLAVESARDD